MRAYVKPELYCETFELSQHIATCGVDMNSVDGTCPKVLDEEFWPGMGGSTLFDAVQSCTVTESDIGGVYCYTVGTNVMGKLFNS